MEGGGNVKTYTYNVVLLVAPLRHALAQSGRRECSRSLGVRSRASFQTGQEIRLLGSPAAAKCAPTFSIPIHPNLGRQVLGLAEWLSEHAESSWDTHLSVGRTANNVLNFVNPSRVKIRE